MKHLDKLPILAFLFAIIIGSAYAAIISGDVIYTSINTNITQDDLFTHLNISTSSPYNTLLFYFPFDKDNNVTAFDYSNNNFNGTYSGGAVATAGCLYNDCLNLDGIVSRVNLTNYTGLNNMTTGSFSVWFRIRGNNTNGINYLASKSGANRIFGNVQDIATGKSVIFFIATNQTAMNWATPGWSYNTWTHYVVVWNLSAPAGQKVRQYLNGANVTSTGTDGTGSVNDDSSGNFIIGGRQADDLRQFNGTIEEMMLFSGVLSDSDVLGIFINSSSRFFATGEQLFTGVNLGFGNDTANISIASCETNGGSNLLGKINDGSFQLLSNCALNGYTFTGNATSANVTIKMIPNNGGFYSPIVSGNITVTTSATGLNGSISIAYPSSFVTYQRDAAGSGDIFIVGTYTGSGSGDIEASFNGGTFTTINTTYTNGKFWGVLLDQPLVQGTLTVRFAGDPTITASVVNVSIGDVYVIGGASNAVGMGTSKQTLNVSNPFIATVFMENDSWKIANDPTSNNTPFSSFTNNGSWVPALANLITQNANIPVGFIAGAVSGSFIGQFGDTPAPAGLLYVEMRNQIRDATNGSMRVKTVLFQSGGNDAITYNNVTYNSLVNNLTIFAARFINDTNIATEVIVSEKEARFAQVNRTTLDMVRRAQMSLWNTQNFSQFGPTLHDIPLGPDTVHFDTNQSLTLEAQRFWKVLDDLYYSGADGRGPVFVSAVFKNSTNTTIFLSYADDSLPILPASGIKGFYIVDAVLGVINGTNITSATASSNTITLTIERSLSGIDNISYASFNDAYNTTSATDSVAGYNLPAEFFYQQTISAAAIPSNTTSLQQSCSSLNSSIVGTIPFFGVLITVIFVAGVLFLFGFFMYQGGIDLASSVPAIITVLGMGIVLITGIIVISQLGSCS